MALALKKLKSNQVLKNFGFVTIGSILAQLLNLLALIKLAKFFNPGDYGLYTFLTVQGQLLFALADIGIKNIVIRTIARDKASTKDVVYNGIIIRIISVILFSAIYFGYNRWGGSLITSHVILICIFAFSNCITNLFESAFWGHQKMLTPAILNVSTSLLWYIFVLVMPTNNIQVGSLFAVYIGTNVLTGISYFIVLKANKLIQGTMTPFLESSSKILKQSWPYFVLMLLGLPYSYITNNFLDINSTKAEIGYFNLTQKLMSPISLMITFSLSSLFPNLSNLWTTDQEKFRNLLNKGIRYFMLLALLLCFLYDVFAPVVIKLLFSKKYYETIAISQIQVWYVFLMGMNSLIGTIWGATNNEKLLVKSSLINAAISVPLMFWGSKHGALGLSYGYVSSFALFEIYLWLDFKRTVNIKVKDDLLLWALTVVLFVVAIFLLVKLSFLLQVIIALAITASILLFLYRNTKKSSI